MISQLENNEVVFVSKKEEGFSMVEVIVSILIIAIMSLGILSNILMALRSDKLIEINQAAYNLALSRVEQFAAIKPSELDASDNSSETALTVAGLNISFSRTTTVTVNADNSRTITVDVQSESNNFDTGVNYSTTFAVWE